jgi:hypothetical protein
MALPRFALVAHGPPRSRSAGLISGAPRSTALRGNSDNIPEPHPIAVSRLRGCVALTPTCRTLMTAQGLGFCANPTNCDTTTAV